MLRRLAQSLKQELQSSWSAGPQSLLNGQQLRFGGHIPSVVSYDRAPMVKDKA